LYLYTPEKVRGHLGTLSIHPDLTSGVGFVIEFTLMFIVMMAVIVTTDPSNNLAGLQSPLVVGMSFTAALLMGVSLASMILILNLFSYIFLTDRKPNNYAATCYLVIT